MFTELIQPLISLINAMTEYFKKSTNAVTKMETVVNESIEVATLVLVRNAGQPKVEHFNEYALDENEIERPERPDSDVLGDRPQSYEYDKDEDFEKAKKVYDEKKNAAMKIYDEDMKKWMDYKEKRKKEVKEAKLKEKTQQKIRDEYDAETEKLLAGLVAEKLATLKSK